MTSEEFEKENEIVKEYPVSICNGCINLIGGGCSSPGCIFIYHSTPEIKELLNLMMIRPLVDGKPVYETPSGTIDPIPEKDSLEYAELKEKAWKYDQLCK